MQWLWEIREVPEELELRDDFAKSLQRSLDEVSAGGPTRRPPEAI